MQNNYNDFYSLLYYYHVKSFKKHDQVIVACELDDILYTDCCYIINGAHLTVVCFFRVFVFCYI